MNTNQTAAHVARRLPAFTRRDIREMLEVLTEIWRAELARPDGEIRINGLGTLYVETHTLRSTGVIHQQLQRKYGARAPLTIQRRSIRFRPYASLRLTIAEQEKNHE